MQAQQATLARHEIILQAIYTSVTLHTAAREQRQGRNLRFDEICATQTGLTPLVAPRAETCERHAHGTHPILESAQDTSDKPTAQTADETDVCERMLLNSVRY